MHPRGQGFEFVSNSHNFIVPELGLKGPHQFINAGTAIATALLALPQLKLSEAVVCAGLAKASWPGRLQKLTAGYLAELLPHGVELWLDGAHNPAGAQALAAWLELEPKMPTGLILGMTKKRNVQAFLAPLHTHISHIAGVLVTAEPSSYPASYIANEADKIVPATECVDLKQAVAFLAQGCRRWDGLSPSG